MGTREAKRKKEEEIRLKEQRDQAKDFMVGDLVNQSTEIYMPKNKRKVNVLSRKPLKLPPKQKKLSEEVLKDREKLNFTKIVDNKGLEERKQYELP